jgi:hypothetical protein
LTRLRASIIALRERDGEVAVGGARLGDGFGPEVGNSHAEILGPKGETLRVDAVLGRPGLQCLRRELPLHGRAPSRASGQRVVR